MLYLFFTPSAIQAKTDLEGFNSIMSVLRTPATFSVLLGELNTTKVNAFLEQHKGETKQTLFAPTDDAFNIFGQIGVLRGTPMGNELIKYHIIEGTSWQRKQLRNGSRKSAKTLSGKTLNFKDIGKILYSIETDNGIIHVIDKVLVPEDIKKKLNLK